MDNREYVDSAIRQDTIKNQVIAKSTNMPRSDARVLGATHQLQASNSRPLRNLIERLKYGVNEPIGGVQTMSFDVLEDAFHIRGHFAPQQHSCAGHLNSRWRDAARLVS